MKYFIWALLSAVFYHTPLIAEEVSLNRGEAPALRAALTDGMNAVGMALQRRLNDRYRFDFNLVIVDADKWQLEVDPGRLPTIDEVPPGKKIPVKKNVYISTQTMDMLLRPLPGPDGVLRKPTSADISRGLNEIFGFFAHEVAHTVDQVDPKGLERRETKLPGLGSPRQQEVEYRTDLEAIRLLGDAGYPPSALHDGLEHAAHFFPDDENGNFLSSVKAATSSHPPMDARLSYNRTALLVLGYSEGIEDHPQKAFSEKDSGKFLSEFDRLDYSVRHPPRSLADITSSILKVLQNKEITAVKPPSKSMLAVDDGLKKKIDRDKALQAALAPLMRELHAGIEKISAPSASDIEHVVNIEKTLARALLDLDSSIAGNLDEKTRQRLLATHPLFQDPRYKEGALAAIHEITEHSKLKTSYAGESTLQAIQRFLSPQALVEASEKGPAAPWLGQTLARAVKLQPAADNAADRFLLKNRIVQLALPNAASVPGQADEQFRKLASDYGPTKSTSQADIDARLADPVQGPRYREFLQQLWKNRGAIASWEALESRSAARYLDWSRIGASVGVPPRNIPNEVEQETERYLHSQRYASDLAFAERTGLRTKESNESRDLRVAHPYLTATSYELLAGTDNPHVQSDLQARKAAGVYSAVAYHTHPEILQNHYQEALSRHLQPLAAGLEDELRREQAAQQDRDQRHASGSGDAVMDHYFPKAEEATLTPAEEQARAAKLRADQFKNIFLAALKKAHDATLSELGLHPKAPVRDSVEGQYRAEHREAALPVPLGAELARTVDRLPLSGDEKRTILQLYFTPEDVTRSDIRGLFPSDARLLFQELGKEGLAETIALLQKHKVIDNPSDLIHRLTETQHRQRNQAILDPSSGNSTGLPDPEEKALAESRKKSGFTSAHLSASFQFKLMELIAPQLEDELQRVIEKAGPQNKSKELIAFSKRLFSPEFAGISSTEDLRTLEGRTEILNQLRSRILAEARKLPMSEADGWALHNALSRSGPTPDTDNFLDELSRRSPNGNPVEVERALVGGRVLSIANRSELAKRVLKDDLTQREHPSDLHQVQAIRDRILAIFPEASGTRDELLEEMLWHHGVSDPKLMAEIEDLKSYSFKSDQRGESARKVAALSALMRDFTGPEKLSLIRYLSTNRSATVPDEVRTALDRGIHKTPPTREALRSGNAGILNYYAQVRSSMERELALMSLDGTAELRIPVIEFLLASGRPPLIDKNKVEEVSRFLQNELGVKPGKNLQQILAYFDASIAPKRPGGLAYLLANAAENRGKAGGVLNAATIAELHGTLGIKGHQLAEVFRQVTEGNLKDGAKPLPMHQALEILRATLAPAEFAKIKRLKARIGSASIKTSYLAELADGSEIVVQIQRPNAKQQILANNTRLRAFNDFLQKRGAGVFTVMMDQMAQAILPTVLRETDFRNDAKNIKKQKAFYDSLNVELEKQGAKVRYQVPDVSDSFKTYENVIFVKKAPGRPYHTLTDEEKAEVGPYIGGAAIRGLFDPKFQLFDPDRHGGNTIVSKEGDTWIISPIDFGQTEQFSRPGFLRSLFTPSVPYQVALWFKGLQDLKAEDVLNRSLAMRKKGPALTAEERSHLTSEIDRVLKAGGTMQDKIIGVVQALAAGKVEMRDEITFTVIKGLMVLQGEDYFKSPTGLADAIRANATYAATHGPDVLRAAVDQHGLVGGVRAVVGSCVGLSKLGEEIPKTRPPLVPVTAGAQPR